MKKRSLQTSPNFNQMPPNLSAMTRKPKELGHGQSYKEIRRNTDRPCGIRLSCLQVFDHDDAKKLAVLEQARRELIALVPGRAAATVVPFPEAEAKRAAG
jgi:hypothetical protein